MWAEPKAATKSMYVITALVGHSAALGPPYPTASGDAEPLSVFA